MLTLNHELNPRHLYENHPHDRRPEKLKQKTEVFAAMMTVMSVELAGTS